jgi:CheY-like chemotaxis protein
MLALCKEKLTPDARFREAALAPNSKMGDVRDLLRNDAQTTRVLLADDDQDVCTLLEAVLAPYCEVTAVADAESALECLEAQPPFDIIISDYMLPGITGLEFVARVRRGGDERTPILMISGHGSLEVGDRAKAAGANAFLDKPFTLTQLKTTLGSLLQPHARIA